MTAPSRIILLPEFEGPELDVHIYILPGRRAELNFEYGPDELRVELSAEQVNRLREALSKLEQELGAE